MPQELLVFLSCFNLRADVARAQQFREGHTPTFFCNQNHSSPKKTIDHVLIGNVGPKLPHRMLVQPELIPPAEICWWVKSVL